ncbi:MAG: hypothetical protein LBO78_00440 [Rickettsiales bacterium]|jgi:putative addiction module antidote|nr:hypothetical protein [Rickettsiales bacterium]
MTILTIRQIGSSMGVILPKELLAKLKCKKGDKLFAIDAPDGIKLSAYEKEYAENMETFRKIVAKKRSLFNKLSKA